MSPFLSPFLSHTDEITYNFQYQVLVGDLISLQFRGISQAAVYAIGGDGVSNHSAEATEEFGYTISQIVS